MSLETRLLALVQAIGSDVKTLTNRVFHPTVDLNAPQTDKITSITVVDDGSATGSWPNRWEWKFFPQGGAASLVNWINEYGELRLVPAKVNTVAFRIFGRHSSSDPAHSGNLLEIQNNRNDRVTTFGVDESGNVVASGDITRAVPNGPTLKTGYLLLGASDPVPNNTPANTLIIRTT